VSAQTVELLGAISVWGLLTGIALDLLTFVIARYGPQGGDEAPWSFRGNGALVVPFGLGPVCAAAGWTALVLCARGVKRWRRWTVATGLVGALIALVSVGVLISFGSAGQANHA